MKEKCEKIAQAKGITLIALVVTIVVLLILAGVSIIVLFGDKGIIKTAQEATKNYSIESEKEKIENVKIAWISQKHINSSIGLDDFWNKLIENEILDKNKKPASPTKQEGENSIYEITTNNGYTIEIVVDNKRKYYNWK